MNRKIQHTLIKGTKGSTICKMHHDNTTSLQLASCGVSFNISECIKNPTTAHAKKKSHATTIEHPKQLPRSSVSRSQHRQPQLGSRQQA
mmetsp:Transcript_57803/g.91869  ORF Transcript_57803/g.91869 Transcript_57803/m.91869 type:complete len:89 (+) Transcript_57803:74-340(+)